MLPNGLMIIISLFAGIIIPTNVDKAKIEDLENVFSGPHYPSVPQSNIVVADSSISEYSMWTQNQECLAYNPLLGYLQFVCRDFAVGSYLNVWQTDSAFSFTITDTNVYAAQLGHARYPNSIASDDGTGNGPHISFPHLISGAWGGMGAQYESGGWYSSYWDVPVDVGTGDLGTYKNIGKQLPNGNILFIGVRVSDIVWSTYTPDLSTRLAGDTVAPAPAYYWGFDINGGIAYLFYYSDSLYYKTTTDGITWSPRQTYDIIWPQPFPINMLYWHQMAATDAGNPILVFDNTNGNDTQYPYEGKIYVSIASGQPCIEVGVTTSGAENFYPTVAAEGNYVVVLFGETRSGSGQYTFWDIYYNYSADNGATWSTPRNLTAGIADHNNCLWQIAKRIMPAGDGQFFFAFGCGISDPLLDLYWNINNSNPICCRWYVGRNPIVVGIAEHKTQTPTKLALNVLPNPAFNRSVISYALPTGSNISLKLYSADGRLVKILDQGYRPSGNYTSIITADGLSTGAYFLMIETKNYKVTRSLVVVH